MLRARRIMFVLKKTGAIKLFTSFIIFLFIVSIILCLIEPDINTVFDGFWYSFITFTTIGFGDFVAVTTFGKIFTIILSLYGILITAMLTGVIVSYYTEYLKDKNKETISTFLEKLQILPELSHEELEKISNDVKHFINKK